MKKLTIQSIFYYLIYYALLKCWCIYYLLLFLLCRVLNANSTYDNSCVFKMHHCCYCKQPHHLQSVHSYEPEVAKALTFDKSSQERKLFLNLLQTRRNILHNTNVVQSSKQDSKPFGKFASDCSFDDSVYCIYCLGLFNKKYFASHLEQCKGKSTQCWG